MIAASTVGEGLTALRQSLRGGGIEAWALEARLLMAEAVGISASDIFAHPARPLSAAARGSLATMTRRRLASEPLAYILGSREFWSLPFHVGPTTLIPRPETELIVSLVLERCSAAAARPRILDLGTGSGCIILSILHEIGGARGVGVDISEPALRVARTNAVDLNLASRAQFVCSDWVESVQGRFDVIVANPPYIPTRDIDALMPDVRQFEPLLALDGGDDGLAAYRRILGRVRHLAAPNALMVMEISPSAAEDVRAMMIGAGFDGIATEKDLAGRQRCILARHGNDTNQKKSLGNGSLPV